MDFAYGRTGILDNFKHSGSKLMNVNGSITPVVFSYVSGLVPPVAITGLFVLLSDIGAVTFDRFGALTALTVGLTVTCTLRGVTYTIMNIKDNADLCTRFMGQNVGTGMKPAFGQDSAYFAGYVTFAEPLVLTTTDTLAVTVADNLSSIGFLQMGFKGVLLAPQN